MAEIPLFVADSFVRTIRSAFGERGTEWLKRLPTLLADCVQRWSLTLLPPFPNLSFNYVTPVIRADGTAAVLKAGVPHKELWTEIAALRLYDGRNTVRLLEADEEAETLFAELLDSQSAPVLLHGDLHHDNILSAERLPWLAIDPKGLVGEPAYEAGALLRNLWEDRHPRSDPGRMLERRVRQLAEELDIDAARIRGWGVAQAVLSAWWTIEDNGDDGSSAIAIAELLSAVEV
jgi:streptomycin 6-kinase